ncbi:MAG: SGNH/GDSL hydrolase family protein [Firmicutes bacterium]|nr:SGNH/GDSL hydrolase family protein [Bacillota bacterium]
MDISKIDKNFKVVNNFEKEDIAFHSADEKPFKIYGIFKENGKYRRMPEDIASNVNEGVFRLHTNTAGGRVRFVTDSAYVAIRAEMDGLGKMPHFALTGSVGFDLYENNIYKKTFVPGFDVKDGFEGIIEFETRELREITINFPLYSNVNELYIGLQQNAVLKEAAKYKDIKPIVYYGSSITQGGCASRPGMSYQSIISRRLGCDYVNLGFSGSARAEDIMAEYIKKLDMSLFVFDYDHNAPTVQYLKDTHEKMFKTIRKKNPDLPIIMMSRPNYILTEEEKQRLCVVKATYDNAKAAGDENVYFISGQELCAICKNEGTVDGCHPTDLGFFSIAQVLGDIIEKILFPAS